MSDVRIDETCACGATITVQGSPYRSSDPRNPRGAEEMVERWRVEHRHPEATVDLPDLPTATNTPDVDLLTELDACTTTPEDRRARLHNAITIAKAGGIDEPTLEALLHLANAKAMTSTAARALRDVGINPNPWGPQ